MGGDFSDLPDRFRRRKARLRRGPVFISGGRRLSQAINCRQCAIDVAGRLQRRRGAIVATVARHKDVTKVALRRGSRVFTRRR